MTNRDLDYAREYHELSKNSPESVAPRRVSAELIPRNHKLYLDRPVVPLPPPRQAGAPALATLSGDRRPDSRALDVETLSSLLYFSAGTVRRTRIGDKTLEFRAAACTGACYHVDLYVVTGNIDGLSKGVYQYGVHDETLVQLRDGDFRSVPIAATCEADAALHAEAFVAFTSTFWRNAWRYEDRSYRHAFWDSGTIAANLLALASGHGIDASLLLGFVDSEVNALIDVDGTHEAALGIIALGRTTSPAPSISGPVKPVGLSTVPLSAVQIEYPSIQRLHEASILQDCEAVEEWRVKGSSGRKTSMATPSSLASGESLEALIQRRGSARLFKHEAISREQLDTVLDGAMSPFNADFLGDPTSSLVQPYLIVHAVEGLRPGVYRYEASRQELPLVQAGDFRDRAGHLALDQLPAADAAVNIYFLSDLEAVLERFGNRGYRAAQLEGGVRGGRVYLAAYALGLRATGLTFYDDEVSEFFGAARLSPMFLIAVGR